MLGSSLFVCTTLNGERWRGVRKKVTKNWCKHIRRILPVDVRLKQSCKNHGDFFGGGFLKQQLLVPTQLRKEIEKECLIWPSLKGINGITSLKLTFSPLHSLVAGRRSGFLLGQVRPIFCPNTGPDQWIWDWELLVYLVWWLEKKTHSQYGGYPPVN